MKQPVRLYAWLTGLALLVSQSLLAQTDTSKPKSRLELGQKPAPTSRVFPARNYPFLKNTGLSTLDRGVQKNSATNQFYRNQLLTSTASKTPARAASSEPNPLVALENRSTVDVERKVEENMYENDRIRVSNIYPNPANESAEIDYQILGPVKDAKLVFYNVLGGNVGEYVLDRNERKIRIGTSNLDSGMYLYQLSLDGKKVATKKLMVSHQ